MGNEWQKTSVIDLQNEGFLLVEDGNHGEYRPRPDEFVDFGTAFIRAADMDDGRVLFDQASKINDIAFGRITKGIGAGGDIILSHKGTVGKVAIVNDKCPPFVCSPQTTFWRSLKQNIIDRWYLYAYLRSPYFHEQLATRSGETDMAPYVSLTSQRSLVVVLPPLKIQKAIANLIKPLDDKIELLRDINNTLESMARTLFKSWFIDFDPVRKKAEGQSTGLPPEIDKLFSDSFEDSELGEIPKGWSVRELSDDFNITMGQSPPGETYNEIGEGLPFYQGSTDFTFRFPEKRIYCSAPKRIANADETLVSVRAPVGDMNIAEEKCCIGRGVASVIHKNSFQSFTYYHLKSLRDSFTSFEAEGTVFGSINQKDFHRIKSILSTTELIEVYEKLIIPIDALIREQSMMIRILMKLRDSLLPKLISGDLELNDKDIDKILEPAK
jgi:type I restriction enzyme, S subunit